MSSIFDAYDSEFASLSQEIQKNVAELKAIPKESDKAQPLINHIDALFSQSNELVKQMDTEVGFQSPGSFLFPLLLLSSKSDVFNISTFSNTSLLVVAS